MNNNKTQSITRFVSAVLAAAVTYEIGSNCAAQTMPEVMTNMLAKVQSSPAQDKKMAWFREAKYGLFIHWGLYAIPAGVWNGKPVRISSEWIMAHAQIPVKEYEQLAKQFNPVDFNAEQWVQRKKQTI